MSSSAYNPLGTAVNPPQYFGTATLTVANFNVSGVNTASDQGLFSVSFASANPASSTFSVNGGVSYPLQDSQGNAIPANFIVAGEVLALGQVGSSYRVFRAPKTSLLSTTGTTGVVAVTSNHTIPLAIPTLLAGYASDNGSTLSNVRLATGVYNITMNGVISTTLAANVAGKHTEAFCTVELLVNGVVSFGGYGQLVSQVNESTGLTAFPSFTRALSVLSTDVITARGRVTSGTPGLITVNSVQAVVTIQRVS